MQDVMSENDILDDIFAEAIEDIKQEEVTVEEQERTRWPHIMCIKQNPSAMSSYRDNVSIERIANMIHKKLLWMGCETSFNKEKYDKYERNDDGTYSFVDPGDKFLVSGSTYMIGFTNGFITFSALYHILELLTHISYCVFAEIDKESNGRFISNDSFIEKTCCNIFGLKKEFYRKKHYECIEREIKGMCYTKKFVKKIANLKSTGDYKFLNCFDVFEDCRLKDQYEATDVINHSNNFKPVAQKYDEPVKGGAIRIMQNNEDFYWDGTPKMSNIKHDLPVTDTLLVGNDMMQMKGMLYWTADLEMLRGTESYPDAFMPKPLPIFRGEHIVSSEILLVDNGRLIVIIELEHIHDEEKINVKIPWLTIEATNFKNLEFMLDNLIEKEGRICAEIIREEVYNRTRNSAYAR